MLLCLGGCATSLLGGMSLGAAFPDAKTQQLIDAAMSKNEGRAKILVLQGANPNAVGTDGILPLVWVIAHDSAPWDRTRILLEIGADPNRKFTERPKPSEDSVMYLAAGSEKLELLEMLLKHGGDPNVSAKNGETALMHAAQEGLDSNIKLLLSHGADTNGHDVTGRGAPYSALTYARFDLVVFFLNNGYTYDLHKLAESAEIRVVDSNSPYCTWKVKALTLLRDKGIQFPLVPHKPWERCLPDWFPIQGSTVGSTSG